MLTFIFDDIFKVYKGYEAIAHGCNCCSVMGSGIAPLMAKEFGCDQFPMERMGSDYNKLGCIDFQLVKGLFVINAYTQNWPRFGECDYAAIELCLKKIKLAGINKLIMPAIGCGLAGGDYNIIFDIARKSPLDITICILPNEKERYGLK